MKAAHIARLLKKNFSLEHILSPDSERGARMRAICGAPLSDSSPSKGGRGRVL